MKKPIWGEHTINAVISGSVKDTSEQFDQRAEAIFAGPSVQISLENQFTKVIWLASFGVAAAAVMVLSLTLLRSPEESMDTGIGSEISYETLVVMDEILKDGTGVLTKANLEALESITWMINNS